MLLALNVGNTTVACGLFERDRLHAHWHVSSRLDRTPDEWGVLLEQFARVAEVPLGEVTAAIVSSVVPPLNWALSEGIARTLQMEAAHLSPNWGIIPLEVDEPERVGADRLADCIAGYHDYGGPLCVIDFGTATTFNLISETGAFAGGAIAPTMELAAEILVRNTAQLFKVELEPPKSAIGLGTAEQLQVGIVLGQFDMITGLIGRFRTEFDPTLRVVATGGRGRMICRHLEEIERYDPLLTLRGLQLAWEAHKSGSSTR